ncbi:hypothetical protein KOW79_007717 [Hemibagrus wyckioides]|uniref:Parathyroid hormone n=1 Tax=Hemibagrus wyckioides TaxID=337641 RepID=A0A9D3NUZ6_9TELE|nr:parathyroid hormone 1a [Hemibagrus wyckioides]KAG7329543.1 hypothetical protein KOW79_007717 [Hemibagrus wyckioides]
MPASQTGLLQSLQLQNTHTHTQQDCTTTQSKRMVSTRSLHKTMVFLCLCVLYNSMRTDSRPLSRRSVSEVQLMHSIGVRKHIQQRQEWLQEHMQDIHTAPLHAGKISGERIMLERSRSPDPFKGGVADTLDTQ